METKIHKICLNIKRILIFFLDMGMRIRVVLDKDKDMRKRVVLVTVGESVKLV